MYASIPPINQYGCFTVNRTWKEKRSDKKFQIFYSLPIYKSGEFEENSNNVTMYYIPSVSLVTMESF
jgi:hypothetical protein